MGNPNPSEATELRSLDKKNKEPPPGRRAVPRLYHCRTFSPKKEDLPNDLKAVTMHTQIKDTSRSSSDDATTFQQKPTSRNMLPSRPSEISGQKKEIRKIAKSISRNLKIKLGGQRNSLSRKVFDLKDYQFLTEEDLQRIHRVGTFKNSYTRRRSTKTGSNSSLLTWNT